MSSLQESPSPAPPWHECQGYRRLRPMNGAFRESLDTSLVCLIATASSLLQAGFIPRRWGKTTIAFSQGTLVMLRSEATKNLLTL